MKCRVVPDGAVTWALAEAPASTKSESSRPSRPTPVPGASTKADGGGGPGGNELKISSQTVPGEPQLKTSSLVLGTSLASTMLRVCGSSVRSECSRVSSSPLLTIIWPGVKRRVDMILALGTNCSLPSVLTVRSRPSALSLTPMRAAAATTAIANPAAARRTGRLTSGLRTRRLSTMTSFVGPTEGKERSGV